MAVAKRRGIRRATVALARKLAIVLHRMWVNGTDFRFGKEEASAARKGLGQRGKLLPVPTPVAGSAKPMKP
jgi:hypothetical protein